MRSWIAGWITRDRATQAAVRGEEETEAAGFAGAEVLKSMADLRWSDVALVHESELAATILTQRLLTYRYRTTLARQGPSSDLGCCMRAAPRPFALLACALEGQCR